MVVVSEIELYNLLREKIGESQAKVLAEYIENKVEKKVSVKKEIIVAELEAKIVESKTEILRWMFGSFLALMLAVIGLYFKH